MAMKKKLDKDGYNKLSEDMKKEYIADGDGYKLDLTDDEDIGPLRRALEREKAAAGTSKARVAELEAELEALNSNDAKKKGDIATLEKQWQKKLDDQKNEFEGKNGKLTAHIKTQLIDNVASSIAGKISTSPAILLPHIRARLVADFDGDTPVTKVLDKDGKPSTATLEDLQKEFVANKDFSAIIVASKASGGARPASNANGGGAPNNQNPPADMSKMSPKQLSEHIAAVKAANQGN